MKNETSTPRLDRAPSDTRDIPRLPTPKWLSDCFTQTIVIINQRIEEKRKLFEQEGLKLDVLPYPELQLPETLTADLVTELDKLSQLDETKRQVEERGEAEKNYVIIADWLNNFWMLAAGSYSMFSDMGKNDIIQDNLQMKTTLRKNNDITWADFKEIIKNTESELGLDMDGLNKIFNNIPYELKKYIYVIVLPIFIKLREMGFSRGQLSN